MKFSPTPCNAYWQKSSGYPQKFTPISLWSQRSELYWLIRPLSQSFTVSCIVNRSGYFSRSIDSWGKLQTEPNQIFFEVTQGKKKKAKPCKYLVDTYHFLFIFKSISFFWFIVTCCYYSNIRKYKNVFFTQLVADTWWPAVATMALLLTKARLSCSSHCSSDYTLWEGEENN